MAKRMAKKDYDKSPFIAIPSALAGIFLVIVVLFLLFAKDSVVFLQTIVWAFVVLGIVALAFAYKAGVKKK
ncbi:hypothetical protein KY348_07085 [Candidatus Woesearchaeota archaeon]|nr:hypothetical protein [Candidatus Woesearchaeota archaeon]